MEIKNEVEMEETFAENEKKASGSQNESHCLCNSRDYTTFMICCDACGVWYHGDCVQVSLIILKFGNLHYMCSFSRSRALWPRKLKNIFAPFASARTTLWKWFIRAVGERRKGRRRLR